MRNADCRLQVDRQVWRVTPGRPRRVVVSGHGGEEQASPGAQRSNGPRREGGRLVMLFLSKSPDPHLHAAVGRLSVCSFQVPSVCVIRRY